MKPTASAIRPVSFDDMVGQENLFGKNGTLRSMVEKKYITNMIFYGPPGTGKTTAANIIAEKSGMPMYRLNATSASLADVKEIINQAKSLFSTGSILLYLDEIQYFNKKQQQSLLEFLEDGRITLIASTTENPYLYVYNAILSRSLVFEFKSISKEDILKALERAWMLMKKESGEEKEIDPGALDYIAECGAGDVRRAINSLENVYNLCEGKITKDDAERFIHRSIGNFDASATVHYDMLSALQKSIRGSDPDAAIFYLAKILEGGDLIGAMRRLQVIASEDIGLAYPMAASITRACVESAKDLGLPEAAIPLANCTIMLATAPKSNSANSALEAAQVDVRAGKGQTIPPYMRPSNNYKNYKYPHDYKNNYISQQYLPNDLKNKHYYTYGSNKVEQTAKQYWDLVKVELTEPRKK